VHDGLADVSLRLLGGLRVAGYGGGAHGCI
jgi:hypothetical protein